MKKKIFISFSVFLIVSCGGGGGSASVSIPSVSISASDTAISINESIIINWSSSLATSCSASGAWSGTKETSGSESFTITSAGANSYSIQCSDSSGQSGSGSVTVNSGYPIAIGNVYHPTLFSNLEFFIDLNRNRLKDLSEPSFTTLSDGSFEYRSVDEDVALCQRQFPVSSTNGILFSPNLSNTGNININPFTSLFSDHAGVNSSSIYERGECSSKDLYTNELYLYFDQIVLNQIQKYDNGMTFEQLQAEEVIEERRMTDLAKFQEAGKQVANEIEAIYQANIDSGGFDVNLESSFELDTSNFRIFLNTQEYPYSVYPNPSTDPNPNAESVDDISVRSSYIINGTFPNYDGSWDSNVILSFNGLLISNTGHIIEDTYDCRMNVTYYTDNETCLWSVQEGIIFFEGQGVDIIDFYQKTTDIGDEILKNEQYVNFSSSGLTCSEWDNQIIRNIYDDRTIEVGFLDNRGSSYFSIDNFDCDTVDAKGRGFYYREQFPDGSSYYVELYDSDEIFFDQSEFFYDDYDPSSNPLPNQIPEESIIAMNRLKCIYEDTCTDEDNGDGTASAHPLNFISALFSGYLPLLGAPGVQLFIRARNSSLRGSTLFMNLSDVSFSCSSPDAEVSSTTSSSSFGQDLTNCFQMINISNVYNTEINLRNVSPYTGVIYE